MEFLVSVSEQLRYQFSDYYVGFVTKTCTFVRMTTKYFRQPTLLRRPVAPTALPQNGGARTTPIIRTVKV